MNKLNNLTLLDRESIYRMRSEGQSLRAIGNYICRSHSTVSKELKRNKAPSRRTFYCSYAKVRYAQELSEQRKHQAKKHQRLRSADVRSYVEFHLIQRRSPRDISLRIKSELGVNLSHESIYQWLYVDKRNLIKLLPRKGKRRNRAIKRKRFINPASVKQRIIDRPIVVSKRLRFGDWEGDTIISRQSKACIFTLTERKSRFTILHKLPACNSESALQALLQSFYQIPKELRLTLTLDNGSENACHNRLSLKTALDVYFCDAYCSWQRGTVENANGFIRRHFPKKTDFNLVSNDKIKEVQDWLNTRRMDCLGGEEPNTIFLTELNKYPNQINSLFPHLGKINQSFLVAA